VPGGNVPGVRGFGFGPNELVDVHIDDPDGPLTATIPTDSKGGWLGTGITLPTPLPGGQHMLYGVGRDSGIVGPGPVLVTVTGDISPRTVAAGDVTVFTGTGFVPQEPVQVYFPNGTPVTDYADATGSVSIPVVSPPEPYGGGDVTAVASSGVVAAHFTVTARFTTVDTAEPYQEAPVTLTGFGADESVVASFDNGGTTQTFAADDFGSVNDQLLLDTTYGNHSITMTGVTTGVSKTFSRIQLPAQMTVAPDHGPVGTVVTITSGPGWAPGSTVHLIWQLKSVKDLVADDTGAILGTWTIPSHSPGGVRMALQDDVLHVQATTTFTVQ
jgi:large repetitive protein